MDIYFEQLTLTNYIAAFLYCIRGRTVYYFELGRIFKRVPLLGTLLKPFHKADYQVSEFQGLSFEIHSTALDAAESLYQQLVDQNPTSMKLWRQTFRSERIHLYIKKTVSSEAWGSLVRYYLLLHYRVNAGHPPIRLVVLDNPINRLLLPFLLLRHTDPGIELNGLSRSHWRHFQSAATIISLTLEFYGRLALVVFQHKFTKYSALQSGQGDLVGHWHWKKKR